MVQVSYPGVYIQEVPSGVHTITGVATSIAAFLGRTSKGPIDKAVRIQSLADYQRGFGAPHPKSDLADSVRLFFANGGTDCYVVRLAKGAVKASVVLKSLKGERVLTATAKAEGTWANTLRLEIDYNTANPDETFNLRTILEEGGRVVKTESFLNLTMDRTSPRFAPAFVNESSELVELGLHGDIFDLDNPEDPAAKINDVGESLHGFSQSRRPFTLAELKTALKALINPTGSDPKRFRFDIIVNDSAPGTVELAPWSNTEIDAASATDIENHFKECCENALVKVDPGLKVNCDLQTMAASLLLLTITADDASASTEPWASVRIRRASSNDIAGALMLGVDQGGIELVRWSNFRPAPTAAILMLGDVPPVASAADHTKVIDAIAFLEHTDITKIAIDGTDVMLSTDPYNVGSPAGKWYKSTLVPGSPHEDNDGVREKLRKMAAAINAKATLPFGAEVWGYHLAVIPKTGDPNTQPASIDTDSGTFDTNEFEIGVRQYAMGTAGSGQFSEHGADGDDGSAPGVAEYLGNETDQTGLHALDPVDLFNLMVLPGDPEVGEPTFMQVVGPASIYCVENRAFLLIDSPASWTKNGRPAVVQDTSKVSDLRALVVKDHSAVFYPRLMYSIGGPRRPIGASGAIAGLMARIDSTRGVWKAPAGVEADIRGILGLDLKLTDMENGVLNKLGVNCLRVFPSGFVNWGARTLDGADDLTSEWKYVPIRRLALFLEESLFRGTKWVVFEPNDEPLWAKIRLNLNAFMMGLFRQGAFQGSTPDQAFYVKCDGETTTQADRNLGIVNIEVGFAPLKPAEFVVIRIQQIVGEL